MRRARTVGFPVVLMLCLPGPRGLASAADLEYRLAADRTAAHTQTAVDLEQAARRILQLTNEFRRQESDRNLIVDEHLREAARYFARYVAEAARLDHKADGSTPGARAKKYGYDYCIIAENLAYEYRSDGFTTDTLAVSIVEGWKRSPEHRKNMLQPDVTQTGVALAGSRTKPGYFYAVQMLGRPQSSAIHFEIANRSNSAIRYQIGGKPWTLSPHETRTHDGCALGELHVNLPGKPTTAKPATGDRYAIVQTGSRTLALRKE
jgi:uncharacterized protein YkwD